MPQGHFKSPSAQVISLINPKPKTSENLEMQNDFMFVWTVLCLFGFCGNALKAELAIYVM